MLDVQQIARICHETNRAYCESIGDFTQKPWAEASLHQKESAVNGVEFLLEAWAKHERPSAAASHTSWYAEKIKAGWKHGPVKDEVKKEHPCLVPYDLLPTEQRMKDYLFQSVVGAFEMCEQGER